MHDLDDLDQAWNRYFELDQITPPEKEDIELCCDCEQPFDVCAVEGCIYTNEDFNTK